MAYSPLKITHNDLKKNEVFLRIGRERRKSLLRIRRNGEIEDVLYSGNIF